MKSRWLPAVLVVLILSSPAARGQNYTNRGATLGGLAGALTGAAIGKQNDETAAGALIGGALGLVTGATIGSNRDAEVARAQAYQHQFQGHQFQGHQFQGHQFQGQQFQGQQFQGQHLQGQQFQGRMSRAVSTRDALIMTSSGLSDQLIVNHIHQNGVQRRLEVSDVIALHQQGVSEAVITALQRAPLAHAYRPSGSRPIVVQEHHYVAPPNYFRPPRYPHHRHHQYHPGRSGVSWGVRVGF